MSDAGPDAEGTDEARAPREARARRGRAPSRRDPSPLRRARAALRAGWRALRDAARSPMGRNLRRRLRRRLPLGFTVLVTAVLLACYTQAPRSAKPPAPSVSRTSQFRGKEPRVRVALVEAAPVLSLTLSGAWVVKPDVGEPIALGSETVFVRVQGGGLTLDGGEGGASVGWPQATELTIGPGPAATAGQTFEVGARRFRGDIRVRRVGADQLRLITGVGLEDYLAGVIGHEMPLRWSDAALHAQAIAARTYALASLRPNQDHDLKSDERSQVYRGIMSDDARARGIVDATRSAVLTWNGEIFTTYFHSTCGGDTVPAQWIFGPQDDIPPLQGATGCKCQASRLYRWLQEVPLPDPGLRELVLELPLQAVAVDAWPRGGYVKTVTFVDAGGERITRTAAEVRRLLKLKSTAFQVTLLSIGGATGHGTTLVIEGRGWGHGVGLCQYGAEGFAKEGRTGEEILAHFYPGAKLEKLGY